MLKRLLAVIGVVATGLAVGATPTQAASGVWASTGSHPGTAKVGWANRGGNCHIRYTESNQQMYKYHTATSCDNAALEIGYLTAGVKYRFQVMEDGGVWSKSVWAVASGRHYAAKPAAKKVAHAGANYKKHAKVAHVTRETVKESFGPDDYPTHEWRDCDHQGSMRTSDGLNHDERRSGKCGSGMTNVRTVSAKGAVTLHWSDNMLGAKQFHVMYGTRSGEYTMGALNIGGEGKSFTVRGLTAGQRYYFKLVPVVDGKAIGSSWEVSDIAR